jgi:putative Mg2+ transporter-C (MgtC) family protein
MLARLGTGVVLGAAIGYEREVTGRPAGLRTHLVVALASTTFMLVSTQFVYFQHYTRDDLVAVDPSRIAASVVAGVGFLGAGAILRTGISVHGLTTAASLWLVAALGLASGAGMYLVAGTVTVVSLLALTVLRRVEGKQWRLLKRYLVISVEKGGLTRQAVIDQLRRHGATHVFVHSYDRNEKDGKLRLDVEIYVPNEDVLDRLLIHLDQLDAVRRVKMQRHLT